MRTFIPTSENSFNNCICNIIKVITLPPMKTGVTLFFTDDNRHDSLFSQVANNSN